MRLAIAICSIEAFSSRVLLALGRRRVREDPVGHVQDLVDGLGRERVGHLAEGAQAVLICLGFERIASQTRSAASSGVIVGNASYIFVGAIIGVRTSGMWIVVKVMPSPMTSEDDDARPRVERRLRGDVGAEARRVRLHADRARR